MSEVVPIKDISWYIKWGASILITLALIFRQIESIPILYDNVLLLTGCSLWLLVGYLWNDKTIIVFNIMLMCIVVASLFLFQ